ncbi:hypothetical protein [Niveibacterium sp.]|uniref:hypothetical protein n=1 Tax=Niveibacterium sp. TaxID=2017444 RepID=UPI0035B24EE2
MFTRKWLLQLDTTCDVVIWNLVSFSGDVTRFDARLRQTQQPQGLRVCVAALFVLC